MTKLILVPKFLSQEIPSNWTVKTLNSICKFKKGISYTSEDLTTDKDGNFFMNLLCFKRGGGFSYDGIKFF